MSRLKRNKLTMLRRRFSIAFACLVIAELLAAVILSVSLVTPRWIEIRESLRDTTLSSRLSTYAGLWRFCFTMEMKIAGTYIEGDKLTCETIDYEHFKVQLHYEQFTEPMTTFSLIANYKSGMPFYVASAACLALAICLSPLLMISSAEKAATTAAAVAIHCHIANGFFLAFSSITLAAGCLHFLGAVDFEGLNDAETELTRSPAQGGPGHPSVTYQFGLSFKMAFVAFVVINAGMVANTCLWSDRRRIAAELFDKSENVSLRDANSECRTVVPAAAEIVELRSCPRNSEAWE